MSNDVNLFTPLVDSLVDSGKIASKHIKKILGLNILDFNKDIYNNNIKVYFLDRIRDEKKFSSLDELKIQLEKDKKFAKNQSEKIIL